jgi:hypothetical protein
MTEANYETSNKDGEQEYTGVYFICPVKNVLFRKLFIEDSLTQEYMTL